MVAADGSGESLLATRVAPLAPVWSPLGAHQLAFLGAGGRLRLLDTDSRRSLASAPALAATTTLGWAAPGSPLLEASPRALRTRSVASAPRAGRLALGPARMLSLPPAATVNAAAFTPRGSEIAALLSLPADAGRPAHSEVVLIDPSSRSSRRLLNVPGSLSDLLWSPDASRLLVAWPDADQWLFIPLRGDHQGRAFGPISPEFAPGAPLAAEVFPRFGGLVLHARSLPLSVSSRTSGVGAGTIRVGDPLMARAIWSGSISFGLLNVPVKLYSAVARRSISLREIRESDGARIRHRRVAEGTDEEVPYEEIVKAFEITPGSYVPIGKDEIASLAPKKTRAIEVQDFVDLEEIDPIYFDSPYYLGPAEGAEKAYSLLAAAMEDSGKVAIARFVFRNKEHLAAIRPAGRRADPDHDALRR